MKVSELVEKRLAYAELEFTKHGRATSSLGRERAALEHFRATPRDDDAAEAGTLGQVEVERIAKTDLRRFMRRLADAKKPNGEHYALRTINDYRKVILRVLAWAEDEEEWIPAGTTARIAKAKALAPGKTKARRSKKVAAASEEVIDAVAAFARRHAEDLPGKTARQRERQRRWTLLGIALDLMWLLGCRPGELVQMRPCDIEADPDFPAGWVYTPPEWKTEHEGHEADRRTIYIDRQAKALIDEAVRVNMSDGHQTLLSFAVGFCDRDRVFPWRSEDPNHARSAFGRALSEALKKAGLPHQTNHQIRHAFITRAAAVNVEGARVQAGHSHLGTTSGYLDNRGPAVRSLFAALSGEPDPSAPPPKPAQAAGGETSATPPGDPGPRLRLVRD